MPAGTASGARCWSAERGGVRAFATLDAVARSLAGLGLPTFRVNTSGLAGAGDEPP